MPHKFFHNLDPYIENMIFKKEKIQLVSTDIVITIAVIKRFFAFVCLFGFSINSFQGESGGDASFHADDRGNLFSLLGLWLLALAFPQL